VAGLQPLKIAVLDDYQSVALSIADWSALHKRASVTAFSDHLADPDAVVARLHPFSTARYLSYTVGLGLAVLATIASFIVAQINLLWTPGVPVGLVVLAFASTNNTLALAFGVLIVFLVITGSVWIITHLHNNIMPMSTE
jgi:cytochrome o ubiquinol oxidase operon protein cyoD